MKLFTTSCLIGSFFLCFIYIWLLAVAGNPHHTKAEKLIALQRMEATILLIIFCVVGATVGAIVIVRTARQGYREEAMANMRNLIEAAQVKAKSDPDE